MKMVLLVSLLIIAGCSADPKEVKRVLQADGCIDIQDNGPNYIFDGCSKHDWFNNQFSCKKNNQWIEGVVCSGFFKGYTIRYY
jgi:hypothetical protein